MKKKRVHFILFFMMVLSVLTFSYIQAEEDNPVKAEDKETEQEIITGEAGDKGDNVIYTYNKNTKTMTFSGSGK